MNYSKYMKSFLAQYLGWIKPSTKSKIKLLLSNRITQEYRDLEYVVRKNARKTRVEDALSSPESWKWVLCFFLVISILLFGGSIFFTSLSQNYNFWWVSWKPISLHTAQNLIDQRISKVATIIGLSLTVSTLLISNLAEKESNYYLLFKTVFIYPIIYYALGLMIWLEGISLLKESFSETNSYIFVNAVTFTHFLITLLLLSIAYLFSQLIPLLNPEFLHEKTLEDLEKNAQLILFDEIIAKERELIKEELFEKDYVRPQISYLLVKPRGNYISNYDSYNKTIERQTIKIKAAIEKGDLKALQRGLEFYEIGYKVSCTYLKSNKFFCSIFDEPTIIKGRRFQLNANLNLAVTQKKTQAFEEILYFISKHLGKSQFSDTQIVFYQLTHSVNCVFKFINPQFQSFYLTEILKLIDRKLSPFFSPNNVNPEIDNTYQLQYYTLLLNLIQETLKHFSSTAENKSLEGFLAVMKVLNDENKDSYHKHFETEHSLRKLTRDTKLSENERAQIKIDLEQKIRLYNAGRHASFAIKSWLFYLYSFGFIDGKLLKIAIQSVSHQFDDSKKLLSDFCAILKADGHYLGFYDWDFRELKYNGRDALRSAIVPNNWLPYGLLCEILQHDLDENADYSTIESSIKWQSYDAEWPFDLIADKKQDWLEILEIDAKTFENRKIRFRKIIGRLVRQEKLTEQQNIANQTLEKSKVDNFKDQNFKSWKHNASILSVFEFFGSKVVKPIADSSLALYPFNHGYPKSAFVKQNYSVFMERGNFGGSVGAYFNVSFLEVIDKEKNDQILSYPTVAEAHETISKSLINKGFKPNLVLAPVGFIYGGSRFDSIPSFEKLYGDSEKLVNHSGMIGGDVFVVTQHCESWENKIIICDFGKAFQLLMGEDATRIGNQVEINVREFTEDEFQKLITQDYGDWSENEKLSREETIAKIKNRVVVEMNYNLKFEVIDKEAFEIIEISPPFIS